MKPQVNRENAADAMPGARDADAAFDAWTLEELDDELGSLRSAFTGSDDAGG